MADHTKSAADGMRPVRAQKWQMFNKMHHF